MNFHAAAPCMYAAFLPKRCYMGKLPSSLLYFEARNQAKRNPQIICLMAEMVSRNHASRNSKADAWKHGKSYGLEQSHTKQKSR